MKLSFINYQVRDLYAKMLREVCFDVQKEPVLLPLSGEQFRLKSANTAQEARPDVSARSVWNNLDKVFFDVRIFHHGAKSNQLATVEAAFKKHEDEKKGCIINASHHRCGEGDFYPTCSI